MTDSKSNAIKAVHKALTSAETVAALDNLVRDGCDRKQLIELLARLRRAEVARTRSKKALKRLARTLEEASIGVADLTTWPESPHLGLPDDPNTWLLSCSHDLKLLAEAIRSRAVAEGKHVDPRVDRGRQRLVREVMQSTGQPRDDEVAVLIAAVLRWNGYGGEHHMEWRMRSFKTSSANERAEDQQTPEDN